MSVPHSADLVIDMVDDAMAAYEPDDLTLIKDFSPRDDTIDALRHSIFREGIIYMMEDPKNIPRCTHSIMVARYLERCAPCLQDCRERPFHGDRGKDRDQVNGLKSGWDPVFCENQI